MDAFLTSAAVVAFAEIGDKTMLLAILLAARFRRPVPIILGILGATVANHALAAWLGRSAAGMLESEGFRYAVGTGFVAMGVWAVVPDRLDEEQAQPSRHGAFLTTLAAFFLVEIGDKTQIATIALGAQFESLPAVTGGTTLGMMLANVPAVYLGRRAVERIPLAPARAIAAALFVAIGLWVIGDTAWWW